MAVPHILLISVLLSYLAAGAAILQRLENGTEITQRYRKYTELDRLFRWVYRLFHLGILLTNFFCRFRSIINETWTMHKTSQVSYFEEWHERIYEKMQNISVFFFHRRLTKDQLPLETKWTFPTAILYTLTVLTACGKINFVSYRIQHLDSLKITLIFIIFKNNQWNPFICYIFTEKIPILSKCFRLQSYRPD